MGAALVELEYLYNSVSITKALVDQKHTRKGQLGEHCHTAFNLWKENHTRLMRTMIEPRTIEPVEFQNSFEVKVDGSWTELATASHHFSSYKRIYFAIAGHRSQCRRISAPWHLEHTVALKLTVASLGDAGDGIKVESNKSKCTSP